MTHHKEWRNTEIVQRSHRHIPESMTHAVLDILCLTGKSHRWLILEIIRPKKKVLFCFWKKNFGIMTIERIIYQSYESYDMILDDLYFWPIKICIPRVWRCPANIKMKNSKNFYTVSVLQFYWSVWATLPTLFCWNIVHNGHFNFRSNGAATIHGKNIDYF